MNTAPFANELIRASAGSGKTHQLTNRYLGLLVAGVEPDAILATTFTRKAAAEILDRVLERLAKAAGDEEEAKELATQIHLRTYQRQDFAALLRRVLCRLHRVRIGTLDSFYIALASSFSLELDLPAGWSICEQADDDSLHVQALELLLEQHPDDISKLLPLLSKGELRRSVQARLQEVIGSHYESYRGSEPTAWECLRVPDQIDAATRVQTLDQLRAFDFSTCGHKGFISAQEKDVANFEKESWLAFVSGGLAAKVLAGATAYHRKQIPPIARGLYETLLRHARSEILRALAQQTRATWDLLDRFHQQLWTLKGTSGALRFGEVTQAIVDALRRQTPSLQSLRAEALSFRLDGAIEHLLLDEFQDTSLVQWRVLEPIAQRITASGTEPRSFFCVGDVKQAIYGWRGGMAEIFDTLQNSLGDLQESPLDESRRSAQPIIDVVNKVFGNLGQFQPGDKNQDGLSAWSQRFQPHTTVKKNVPGYVCLQTGPAQQDGENVIGQRGRHCAYVAQKIHDLAQQVPGRSIGVLCRKNDTVARMIYELRRLKVEASEEGGNALTDSPAVDLMLSLFMLADHPGHSIAWFHLRNSPLKRHFEVFHDADSVAKHLRTSLLVDGYGSFTQVWSTRLAAACDERDLRRLQQLVEIAYDYQSRATLRAQDFVAWVQGQHVPDPSGANVRVMTIHGAKGLQFDVVVLPELDAGLTGQTPAFVIGRDPRSLDVNFACRYAPEGVQALLEVDQRRAFEQDRQHRVEESLSVLYVAMTRAVHALHLFIPGQRSGRSDRRDGWYKLLRQTLAPNKPWDEFALLFERGDANWFDHLPSHAAPAVATAPLRPKRIGFLAKVKERGRGLEHVAPSRREGQARVALERLFNPADGMSAAAGTLYHAWFATIAWLDDGLPTDATLKTAAERIRLDLPIEIWNNLDKLLDNFRDWLQNPVINGILRRSTYADPQQPGFPGTLGPFWTKLLAPQQVERERRFLVCDVAKILNGSFDRVVWLGDGDRVVAADVLDFKTDDILPGDLAALTARTEYYRPQMEAYRRAVARLGQLPVEYIATRLVFTSIARVVEVS
jgi:ATP-dependent exoDNAse (exonuclease V) beta subunit